MPKYTRPELTKNQIVELKLEIKLISRRMKSCFKEHKPKFAATTMQNEFAVALAYSSFSELSLNEKESVVIKNFSLLNSMSEEEISRLILNHIYKINAPEIPLKGEFISVYRKLKKEQKDNLTKSNLNQEKSTKEKTSNKKVNESAQEATISLDELYTLNNESDYMCHIYKAGDGFPSEFNINPNARFFKELSDGDHFIVSSGEESRCFTVSAFEHMYDSKKVFKVMSGRWFNLDSGAFCVGNK